jgi:glycosyltransferase involved in cell wall biosynthesis
VYGCLAALGRPQPAIYALTGLGFTFTSDTAKARAIRPLIGALLRHLFNHKGTCVLVQNGDDRHAMERIGIAPQRIVTIAGSGVDTERLVPTPEPAGEITVGFAGRLLDDKGIRPLVAAHRLLRQRGHTTRLLIAGTPDPANPSSVSEAEVQGWAQEPGITWLGHISDIATLWQKSHIAALPSRREGLPKTLLEAAACGRPMVATDVPGCREVAIAGKTGLLVPTDDPQALADAIARLAKDAALRAHYGTNARKLAEERFAIPLISKQITALYQQVATN